MFLEHQVQLAWNRILKKHVADLNMMEALLPEDENLKKIDLQRMQQLSFLDQALFQNNISVSTHSFSREPEANNANRCKMEERASYNVLDDEKFFYREIKYMFERIDPDQREDCYQGIAKMLNNYK